MPVYMGVFDKPNVLSKTIRGDVKVKDYEGWIELTSAQMSNSRPISSPVGQSAKREASAPQIHEIVVTKNLDSVSQALFREAMGGKGKLIVIAFVRDDKEEMRFILQNTLISGYTVSGSGDKPTESLSLNFTKITFEMAKTSPDTTHSSVYKLSQQGSWDSPSP